MPVDVQAWREALASGAAPRGLEPWTDYVERAASTFFGDRTLQDGIEPFDLINATIWVESRGNPRATSGVGAQGLMQLMPATARELFRMLGRPADLDAYLPGNNIAGGSYYLSRLLDRWGGDIRRAVASYYAGAGNVQKYGPSKYQNYVSKVLGFAQRFAAIRRGVQSGDRVPAWGTDAPAEPRPLPPSPWQRPPSPPRPSTSSGGGGLALVVVAAALLVGGANA